MKYLRALTFLALTLVISGGAHAQDHHNHADHEDHTQHTYDDQGLGFDIYTDPNLDFADLPREGVFQGTEVFRALSADERFDFKYCPELQMQAQDASVAADFVVFCIAKGTELGPWNLSESQKLERDGTLEPAPDKNPRFGPVELKAGQTLRLINLDAGDNALHRFHVFDKPCYHQPRLMTPALYAGDGSLIAASYYDCPSPEGLNWDSEKEDGSSALYNHQTKQPFYLRVRSEEVQ